MTYDPVANMFAKTFDIKAREPNHEQVREQTHEFLNSNYL